MLVSRQKTTVMHISTADMEKRRSPQDLRQFAESVRTAVGADPAEFELGMRRRGPYKEFIDEFLPLSHYAVSQYPPTYTIQPVLGNQGFDAIVYDDSGNEFERLELTRPHDGPEAVENAKRLVATGMGKVREPCTELDSLFPFVHATCQAKALKDYSDCTLVVVIAAIAPIQGHDKNFDAKLHAMAKELSTIPFKAKRVVLFNPPSRVLPIDG